MRVEKLVDAVGAGGIRAVTAEKHMDANRHVESLGGFIKREIERVAEMAAFDIGKKRSADKAQFFDASLQFVDAGANVLLRQRSRALDPFRIRGAILGEPGIARDSERGGETGIVQRRQCSREPGAEQ